jgi:hypothetical protein
MTLLLAALLAGCVHERPVAPVDAPLAPAAALDPAVRTVLESGAADPDVAVRRRAVAALLAADPAPAGGPWGPRGRFDPSEYVRASAIEALGARAGEAESRALLRAMVDAADADAETRGRAALALVAAERAGHVPAGELAADQARFAQAAAAVRGARATALLLAAAETGDAPARGRLVEQIASGNLPLDLGLLADLGESREPALAGSLDTALGTVEPEIRLGLAAAVLERGGAAGSRAFQEALAGDEDSALEAVEYLAQAHVGDATGLLQGVPPTASPLVHTAAELALFGRGVGEAHVGVQALGSDDREVRLLAVAAVGRRLAQEPDLPGGDRLRDALRALASPPAADRDVDPAQQLGVADALTGSPRASDRATLTTLLADESVQVRIAAAVALAARPRT